MIPESKRTGQQPTTKTADAVAANPPQKGRYTMAYFYKRKQGITAQKIFNMISDAECEAFCFASDHPKDKKLQECAEHMRKALKAFHEATGAKNEE